MLILKLKQAECALADERLDEAFDLLESGPIRQHRRAQLLIGQLARALATRGAQQLAEGRLQQAQIDCRKAGQLAGNVAQVNALRSALCDAVERQQQQAQQRQAQVARAQRNIDEGRLSVGEEILAGTEGQHHRAHLLVEEAAGKRLELKSIIAKIEEALRRRDIERAQSLLATVDSVTLAGHGELARLAADVRDQLADQTLTHLKEGRLDLAELACVRLGEISDNARTEELKDALELCRAAGRAVGDQDPRQAQECLRKLKLILPTVPWLDAALEQAGLAADRLTELRTGPLGLLREKRNAPTMRPLEIPKLPLRQTETEPPALRMNANPAPIQKDRNGLPDRFLLQIDGVGSYLVLTRDKIGVGPVSASPHPDLGLLMSANVPSVQIAREDEDYFLMAASHGNGSHGSSPAKLLSDGDRISLSHKSRLKFNLPNAASTTATLVVSGARLPRPDINYAILLDRDVLLGGSTNAHIRTSRLSKTLALSWQDGQLFCRNADRVTIQGRPARRGTPLPMNQTIQLDQVSLVITDAS